MIEEFLDFLWHSGFIAESSGPDTVIVSLPMTLVGDRTPEDIDFFVNVWASISVRVWKDLWPGAEAVVLG